MTWKPYYIKQTVSLDLCLFNKLFCEGDKDKQEMICKIHKQFAHPKTACTTGGCKFLERVFYRMTKSVQQLWNIQAFQKDTSKVSCRSSKSNHIYNKVAMDLTVWKKWKHIL